MFEKVVGWGFTVLCRSLGSSMCQSKKDKGGRTSVSTATVKFVLCSPADSFPLSPSWVGICGSQKVWHSYVKCGLFRGRHSSALAFWFRQASRNVLFCGLRNGKLCRAGATSTSPRSASRRSFQSASPVSRLPSPSVSLDKKCQFFRVQIFNIPTPRVHRGTPVDTGSHDVLK